MPNKILIISGEASGDLLGAELARELWLRKPDLQLSALGGAKMSEAGVDIIFDNRAMNILGWVEVIKNAGVILSAMRTVRKILKHCPPDLLILIDYPGFNLRLAKVAKKYGVKVLYYVSPQIWAWKYGRIKTIRKCVDHIAVLFDFEEDIYRREGVPVTFVGHPLAKLVQATDSREVIFQRYRLNPDHPVIALFPGSRRQELRRLMPLVTATMLKIRETIPQAQFVMPQASSLHSEDLQPYLSDHVTVVKNDTYNLLSICTAALVKSGTGTLEVALSQIPLLVFFKADCINYWIARSVIRVRQIGLCNIVAQKTVAKEFIQYEATPKNIAAEALQLITNANYRQQILDNLANLRTRLKSEENSSRVAAIALQLIT